MTPIRVLLADDHVIVRDGLKALLEQGSEFQVIAEAGDGIEAVELARTHQPSVAVIDLAMPRLNGLEVVRRLASALPATRILVLTHHDEPEYVLPLVRAGAHGYLVKDTAGEELRNAVLRIAEGGTCFGPQAAEALAQAQQQQGRWKVDDPYGALTAREREVFHLVCDGLSTKEIARRLDIGVKTAENHRSRILSKLGVKNTAELVRYAARRGLLG